MIRISENVYVETDFGGCNVGFVTTSSGIIVVDTPLRPTHARKWNEEASKRGEIKYLINTEQHGDHISGNYFFPGLLITHPETRKALLRMTVDEVLERVKRRDPEGLPFMEGYKVRLPDITFTETLNLYLGDHTFELIQLPGHVAGGFGVYIPKERVVFSSDCVFCKYKSYLHECDPEQWLKSLRRLDELDVDIIIPGHGAVIHGKEYLKEQANIIQKWVEVVKTAIKQGLNEEEAFSTISCPDPYPIQNPKHMSEAELNRKIIARLYHILSP